MSYQDKWRQSPLTGGSQTCNNLIEAHTHHSFRKMYAHTEDYTIIRVVSSSKLLLQMEFPLILVHHLRVDDEPVEQPINITQLVKNLVHASLSENEIFTMTDYMAPNL